MMYPIYLLLTGLVEKVKTINSLIKHEIVEGPHHFHMANPDSTAQYIESFMKS